MQESANEQKDQGVANLTLATRRAIFRAAVAMAWADRILQAEEVEALKATGEVLNLSEDTRAVLDGGPVSADDIEVDSLSRSEARLVFTVAAWIACVDSRVLLAEEKFLKEFGAKLSLDTDETDELLENAETLRATMPPDITWWREFEVLLERAKEMAAATADTA